MLLSRFKNIQSSLQPEPLAVELTQPMYQILDIDLQIYCWWLQNKGVFKHNGR